MIFRIWRFDFSNATVQILRTIILQLNCLNDFVINNCYKQTIFLTFFILKNVVLRYLIKFHMLSR